MLLYIWLVVMKLLLNKQVKCKPMSTKLMRNLLLVIQRWPADHVTLLTTGNPPKRKKRENFGNAETRDTYLRMNVAQQRKGGVGSVVTSDTLLKFAGARTTTRQKSSVWKIMKAWMTKSLQLSSPLKTSRK